MASKKPVLPARTDVALDGTTVHVESQTGPQGATLIELSEADLIDDQPTGALTGVMLVIRLPTKRLVRYGPFGRGERQAPAIIIGRARHCHVQIDHREVSREHASVQFKGGLFVLTDLQSSTGTYLGDKRISSLRIDDGLEVALARVLKLSFMVRPALLS